MLASPPEDDPAAAEEIGGQSMSVRRSSIGVRRASQQPARQIGSSVGGGPSGRPDVQLLRNMWEERRGVRTRRADWWQQSEMRMLPRVGSLHYLCGHCGHTGHSLLVRDGVKPRSEHNLFQPLPPLGTSHNLLEPAAEIHLKEKVIRRPKSLHSSFEPINSPVAPHDGRRKKRRRR